MEKLNVNNRPMLCTAVEGKTCYCLQLVGSVEDLMLLQPYHLHIPNNHHHLKCSIQLTSRTFSISVMKSSYFLRLHIIRLHRTPTYADEAYCFQLSSSVVCWTVTPVSPAKMDEPIKMPFGLMTRVGPGNHLLNGIHILHGKGQFWGEKGVPLRPSLQKRLNQSRYRLGCELGWA